MSRTPSIERQIKAALLAFLILLLYDGALRKWLFPSSQQLVFVLKDVVLIAAVCWMLMSKALPNNVRFFELVSPFVVLNLFWIALSSLNPWLPNAAVSLWGLKSHLLFPIALFLLVPVAFRDATNLMSILARMYPWIVIPICILGFAQVAAPSDSILNAQIAANSDSLASFGAANLVRVSGPFSYLSGMASFVQTAMLLGIGLLLAGARDTKFLVALACAFAALPITGSRGVIVLTFLGVFIMVALAPIARVLSIRQSFTGLVLGAIFLGLSVFGMSDVWTALEERATSSFGEANRYLAVFSNAFEHFELAGIAGFGTGAANLGAPALAGDVPPYSWIPDNRGFEEESGRIVLEVGILGWGLGLALRVGLVIWALYLALRGRTLVIRVAGILATPTMATVVYTGFGVFAAPVWYAYVWFCVALLGMAQHEQVSAHLMSAPQLFRKQ
jgi:hypothetical protein